MSSDFKNLKLYRIQIPLNRQNEGNAAIQIVKQDRIHVPTMIENRGSKYVMNIRKIDVQVQDHGNDGSSNITDNMMLIIYAGSDLAATDFTLVNSVIIRPPDKKRWMALIHNHVSSLSNPAECGYEYTKRNEYNYVLGQSQGILAPQDLKYILVKGNEKNGTMHMIITIYYDYRRVSTFNYVALRKTRNL